MSDFIAIEGQDGAGKGAVRDAVVAALAARGHRVVATAEPWADGPLCATLRGAMRGDVRLAPEAMGLLFAADRADHVAQVIRPALAAGDVVVCDRYELSNVVYRAAEAMSPLFHCTTCPWTGDDEPTDLADDSLRWGVWVCPRCDIGAVWMHTDVIARIQWSRSICMPPVPVPTVTVVLTVPREVAAARRKARGGAAESYEAAPVQARVATLYKLAPRLLRGQRVAMVDASGTREEVAAAVFDAVIHNMNEARHGG